MAAGSQLSLLCFAELAGRLLPFLYLLQERSETGVWGCPRLPGAARLWRAFWYRKSLAEHKGTQQEPDSRNPRLVSWGLHQTLPLIPSIGPLFVYGPVGGEHRELPLASSIKIILNLLFSRKCRIGWEAAIPGHLADILGLNLLEQSLSLFGRALSKLL